MRAGARAWFESLPVRGKLVAALAVQVAVLTLGCAAFLYAQRELVQAREWITHTKRVLDAAHNLRAEAIEQQSGVRGYTITAREEFLEPYRTSIAEFDAVASDIANMVGDNPRQVARAEQIRALMQEWRVVMAEPAIQWASAPETRHLAVELTANGEGKRRMDAIKRLCLEMVADEAQLLEQRSARMRQMETLLVATVVLLMLIGWGVAMRTVRRLNQLLGDPLWRLTQLLPQLDAGERTPVPYLERRDEIGALAGAFERLRDSSIRQIERDWVAERSTRLMGALQHCESESDFAAQLLRRLAESLDAGYAVAYRWNEASALLEFCGSYGLRTDAVAQRRFRLGEGLVGQSIVEQRTVELSPVPEGQLKVLSALGNWSPAAVLFVPMTARGETVAVLEIGVLHGLQTRQRELLDAVLGTVALAWQALSRSVRTRELLEESRAQEEELRASDEALRVQQEQLRATNDTLRAHGEQLEAQGQRLRASEEELRAQTEELRVTNAVLEEKSEALRQRQQELELMRGELERRAVDLEQASRYKSEFLANMSHELRTPLNSMLILSKLLAENSEGNLDADQIESARIMHESGKSLLALINDILDLSKVEAGKMELHVEPVRLSDCLGALRERFRPLARERGLRFEVELAADLPETLRTDGQRLSQVLTNLLSNAFKFTHEGEVRLSASLRDAGVAFCVRDTGIGIAQGQLERVFEAFEQADSGTSRRYGGTGLGLSIVHRMAALLGGHVRAQSREGEGSAFTVWLPLEGAAESAPRPVASLPAPAATPPAPPPLPVPAASPSPVVIDPPPAEPAGPPALLVVEDDPAFARVLADLAARRGLDVLIAGSGREALEHAARRRLFGVLLDIGLPDMSGWDVLDRLKADRLTAAVPVHVISGREEEAAQVQAHGALGFLQKPVTREAVLAVLDQVACGSSPRAQRRLLLLDQDAGSRAAVLASLATETVQIVEAQDAADALDLLAQGGFDGLILDPDLSDRSGLDFLAQAARQGPLPPVVIYSRRELTAEEHLQLREFTGSIVIHGARAPERLIDEVALFLHALHRPGAAPRSAEPRAPVADLAGKTVLVVDDDMRNVFALSKALRERGLHVVMAQDGHKALRMLESRRDIDGVLMDVMMPGMDGYETMRRIRARPEWQSLPIIAVTAKAMKGDREKCLEAGANDYCAKPIDLDRLMSLLQVWI